MWKIFAILSAVFAALTSILAKVGIKGVNSNLATAIRTVVIIVLAWSIVFATDAQKGIASLTKQNWTFLILSFLILGEQFTTKTLVASILITAGTFLMVWQ
jgi:transporter family protein